MNRRFDVVTGGAGFAGSHLCEALLRQGRGVRVVDDLSSGKRENLRKAAETCPDRLEVFEMDLLDRPGLLGVFQGAERIFRLAAMTSVEESVRKPDKVNSIHADGTLAVLAAARDSHAQSLVFASRTAVYGNSSELPKSENRAVEPASPYALSCSLNRLLKALLSISNSRLVPLHEPPRSGEAHHSAAGIVRASDAIGSSPGVSLEKGLRRTLEWYRSRPAVSLL